MFNAGDGRSYIRNIKCIKNIKGRQMKMEFWFSELQSPHVKFDIRVEKQLFSGKSDY